MKAHPRLALLALLAAGALAFPAVASSDLADETALAEKYAPVVRIVSQPRPCEYGEAYGPVDVDIVFDEPTVALRGPWNATDLVEIGPSDTDLANRFEYHLDFPGNALEPECDYERWVRRIGAGSEPAVYAHVATETARPGQLALQYWLFYVFNQFNNLHEGDWEMIQLVFDASDPAEALGEDPVSVGYSSHEGAERADWGEDKLEVVDGTHLVVYPAAGSHANKYTDALYLGSSADAGVGCDDTRGPHTELRPAVKTIPSDPAAASAAFPWIEFEGRWGELQPAFFNGPTGPNLKQQWLEPVTWSEGWRDRSYAVPTSGVFGTSATDFFCSAVETGSRGLVRLLQNPAATLVALAVLLALVVFLITRTTWSPAPPLRVARRRTWGQILAAAARMYVRRFPLFVGIGLVLIPLSIVISLVQALVLGGLGLAGVDTTGESAGALVILVVAIGTMFTLAGFTFVQAATAVALRRIDEGAAFGALDAYRAAFVRLGTLVRALAVAAVVWAALSLTVFLLPVAIWLAGRWCLLAQVVVLESEKRPGIGTVRRSAELVRGHWFRVASLVVVGGALALLAGPLLGALLIILTEAPLALLNVVAGVVYAIAMPFVALTTSFVYFDCRVRHELEPAAVVDELPAEISLAAR